MESTQLRSLRQFRDRALPLLLGPPILAILPGVSLAAFWFGGETALIIASLGLPLVYASFGLLSREGRKPAVQRDIVTGVLLREGFDRILNDRLADCETRGLQSAVFALELDDYKEMVDRHGRAAADLIIQKCSDRMQAALRGADNVARLGDGRFAVCLEAVRHLDLELCIELSGRLQKAVEEPVSLDGISTYVSCSVGFCLTSRAPEPVASKWLHAAECALEEAREHGPSAIRAYSTEVRQKREANDALLADAAEALETGQIHPWFQPQISTDTGKITGFEALARWMHPKHGMIPTPRFLVTLEQAGLIERLGQVMMYHAFTALKAWDSAGLNVPCVGLNFTTQELRNPGIVERVRWELDRFELTPDRLAVEILETVVTDNPDDTVARNIAGLTALGCRIELDDFGTGHASIASIRRFSISRIKIDRSFVMKCDRDPEQQRMIAGILAMAERLEIETLAEGVETAGEHALLAQLGCGFVQGFGIARPMPFEQTLDWVKSHEEKLGETPTIGRTGS